tara:strand:+ start:315 stop:548 length:234 start_codon:yes stop_codon:yes gene_type:complete
MFVENEPFVFEQQALNLLARTATLPGTHFASGVHNSVPWHVARVRQGSQSVSDLTRLSGEPGQARYDPIRRNPSFGD